MTPNAFWGSKKVFVVNETGCQLAKEIVKELREANFNKAEELKTFDYSAIADAKADYVLSVSEDNECDIIPYKAEGFVGDRLATMSTALLTKIVPALHTKITLKLPVMTSRPTAPDSSTGSVLRKRNGSMMTTTRPQSCI